MEKYLYPAKHIEMQILCDNFGNVVCLGERECSIQRKNQKLIEECPSSGNRPGNQRKDDRGCDQGGKGSQLPKCRNH